MNRVAEGVGGRRARVRRGRGGGGGVVVSGGEVAHTSALLDDGAIREPNSEQLHPADTAGDGAATAGRAGAGVVPVGTAV